MPFAAQKHFNVFKKAWNKKEKHPIRGAFFFVSYASTLSVSPSMLAASRSINRIC